MYGWIGSNYMMICKTKYIEDLMLIYIFLSITLRVERGGGGDFTIILQNVVCLDLSNCSQLNAFPIIGGKFVRSSYALRAGAFCSV